MLEGSKNEVPTWGILVKGVLVLAYTWDSVWWFSRQLRCPTITMRQRFCCNGDIFWAVLTRPFLSWSTIELLSVPLPFLHLNPLAWITMHERFRCESYLFLRGVDMHILVSRYTKFAVCPLRCLLWRARIAMQGMTIGNGFLCLLGRARPCSETSRLLLWPFD